MSGLNLAELMPTKPAPVVRQGPVTFRTPIVSDLVKQGLADSSESDRQDKELARESQRDVRNDARERSAQDLRKQELKMADQRERERTGIAVTQEERRAATERREEADKKRQEHEGMLREWQAALQIPDPAARASAVHYAADALRRSGYQVEEYGQQFGSPPPPPPTAPGAPEGGLEDVGTLQNGRTPGTTHARAFNPETTGEAMDSAGRTGEALDARGARTPRPPLPGQDSRTGRQLETLGAQTLQGLQGSTPSPAAVTGNAALPGAPPRPPLPGQSFQSVSSYLSPGDPYNSIK
jgi:hypothetical protein